MSLKIQLDTYSGIQLDAVATKERVFYFYYCYFFLARKAENEDDPSISMLMRDTPI